MGKSRIQEWNEKSRGEKKWAVVQFALTLRCHPERSRFSGEEKDLPLNWLSA
jgi:hypothetical protein